MSNNKTVLGQNILIDGTLEVGSQLKLSTELVLNDISVGAIEEPGMLIWDGSNFKGYTGTAGWVDLDTQSLWKVTNNIISPVDENNYLEISNINVPDNPGEVSVLNMNVDSATVDEFHSYSFNVNHEPKFEITGTSDGIGGTSETSIIMDVDYQYMGNPNLNGSWRFYIDSNSSLVFEKRISGSWTEAFTVSE